MKRAARCGRGKPESWVDADQYSRFLFRPGIGTG